MPVEIRPPDRIIAAAPGIPEKHRSLIQSQIYIQSRRSLIHTQPDGFFSVSAAADPQLRRRWMTLQQRRGLRGMKSFDSLCRIGTHKL